MEAAEMSTRLHVSPQPSQSTRVTRQLSHCIGVSVPRQSFRPPGLEHPPRTSHLALQAPERRAAFRFLAELDVGDLSQPYDSPVGPELFIQLRSSQDCSPRPRAVRRTRPR